MRLAALSDIHGNLIAFEAALADLEAAGGADIIWILGDLAALGGRPLECIQRVMALRESFGKDKCQVIGGNTDRYLVTGERFKTPPAADEDEFRKLVAGWPNRDLVLNWSAAQLGWEEYEYLKQILGREVALFAKGFGPVIGYHAIPGDDEARLAPDTPDEEARDYLLDREARLGIGGHIHVQMDRDLGTCRVVNIGSVGLSFDMPGKAQWGLFTFEDAKLTVDLRAAPYDVDAAAAELKTVEHPDAEKLAARLRP